MLARKKLNGKIRCLVFICVVVSKVLLFFKAIKLLGATIHPPEIFCIVKISSFISISAVPVFVFV